LGHARDRARHCALPADVVEMKVLPGLGGRLQVRRLQLAHRKCDRLDAVRTRVPPHVHTVERIVPVDGLTLPVGREKWPRVPERDATQSLEQYGLVYLGI